LKKSAPLLWVFRRVRHRIPALILLVLSNILNGLLIVAFSLGTSQVIDRAVAGNTAGFLRAVAVLAGIVVGILLTLTFNRHMTEKLTADMDRDWKKDLLHGLLHGDYAAVSAYHSGELLNRLNNDVRVLNTSLLNALPGVAALVTKLVAATAVLFALEPLFTLLIAAAGMIAIVATALLRRKMKGLHKQVSEEEGKVSGFLQETLEKLLMVQAMDVSREMEDRADDMLECRYQAQRKRKNMTLFANTGVSIMVYGADLCALIWCAMGLMRGTISFGTLAAVIQLVGQLQAPFVNLSAIIPQYVAMTAAAERLMELEQVCGQPVAATEDPTVLYENMTAIEAEDLSFAYDREDVFRGASFSLPKGEFGVIVGQSGIGKSTLLKLILGIFHPGAGRLYVKTEDGAVELDRSTRRLFAYVPQGNLLLSGTLRENLVITRPEATEEEIRAAVHISAMDEFLPSLPQGLDTVLGENAAGLSEGQAQRLSIARAVLSQAPILLLDEATSALDAQTEEAVLRRLRQAGKTCIAVTHRPAAVEISDWSLEMQEGRCNLTRL